MIDGFIVREIHRRVNYNPEKLVYVTSLFGVRVKEINERGKDTIVKKLWNLYQKTNILSLRIIDYLDEFNIHLINTEILAELINKLPLKKFDLLTIHDCMKCHPNYGNDVRQQYNNLIYEICKSNLLEHIARCITKNEKLQFDKLGDISDYILNCNYLLS